MTFKINVYVEKFAKKVQGMMPTDSLSVAVTTGLGFSVLAGIITGVFYIISHGIARKSFRKPQTPWHCKVCGYQYRSIDGILDTDKVITCVKCKAKACKVKCASSVDTKGWTCHYCEQETWFTQLLKVLQPRIRTNWYRTKTMDQNAIAEIDEDALEAKRLEREHVRDFIERLVSALLGGDLDNVSVKRLYDDEKYDALIARNHRDLSATLTDLGSAVHISIANLPITGETPCSAHSTLKSLIHKCIEEASELPQLKRCEDDDDNATTTDAATADRTYEDLLATTIINKVIQNYQDGAGASYSKKKYEKEYFLGSKNLETEPEDVSSMSSLEDWMRSDSRNEKYVDRLSMTIKHNNPSSSDDESNKDADEPDSIDYENVRNNEWQENWYLRKKQSPSPVPVPMLVPNPTNEAKVLIGDRDADDTTDLSDAASDSEEAPEPTNLNMVLVNSKIIIGGRNPIESLVAKAESIIDDTSTDTSDLVQEREDIVDKFDSYNNEGGNGVVDTCNDTLINSTKGIEDTSLLSLESNTEKDLEYTEKYDTLRKTIYKSTGRQIDDDNVELDYTNNTMLEDSKTDNGDSGVTSDEDDKHKIFKGSYSTREKEKWNHGVEMKNNPYSKSNLEQRLNNRSPRGNAYAEFYKKQASLPQGGSFEDEHEEYKLSRSLSVDQVYKAVPCTIEEDSYSYGPKSPLSSDSDYSIERRYNINTGRITKILGNVERQFTDENLNNVTNDDEDNDVDPRAYFAKKFKETREMFSNSSTNNNTPTSNHFNLVHEIANETLDQYENEPISPPAEYKNVRNLDMRKSLENIHVKSEPRMKRSVSLILKMSQEKKYEIQSKFLEEIEGVRQKQVVKTCIQKFQELSKISASKLNNTTLLSEINEDSIEIKDVNTTSVHSLTARCIPVQVRNKLKIEESSDNSEITNGNEEGVDEETAPSTPFPDAKEKILLFENIAK